MQETSFMRAVQAGLEDAEAGQLIEDEELGEVLDREFGSLDEGNECASLVRV